LAGGPAERAMVPDWSETSGSKKKHLRKYNCLTFSRSLKYCRWGFTMFRYIIYECWIFLGRGVRCYSQQISTYSPPIHPSKRFSKDRKSQNKTCIFLMDKRQAHTQEVSWCTCSDFRIVALLAAALEGRNGGTDTRDGAAP
jgi:hypothetical protein